MINKEDLQRCAEIEYDCWKENYAPMLKISEYLYYQTKTSLKKDLEKLLDDENVHILLSHKKIEKKIKKSSSQTLVPQGLRRA